jgi:hypothetical protein
VKGDPKSWRTSSQSPEAKKLEMMRRAKTRAENRYGLGGLLKKPGEQPKPVTLAKLPWDESGDPVSTPRGE